MTGDIPAEARRRGSVEAARNDSHARDYPCLVELMTQLSASGYEFGQEFEFGLGLVLDGIERLAAGAPPAGA